MGCLDENTVAELFDGMLSSAARRAVEEHLDGCSRCRTLVSALGERIADDAVPTSDDLDPRGSPDPLRAPDGLHRGDCLGRYVVLAYLGAGAMGVVYAAYDPELDRKVALKLLRADSESGAARLRREAQSMARLSHPNIVTVHDVGVTGDRVFIAMEYVAGSTLRRFVAADRTTADILTVFDEAGKGLAAAHAAGVVHRDFKPDNVLVGDDGSVRVGDFGLAAIRSTLISRRLEALGTTPSSASTQTGSVLGTPRYMAPEQHEGAVADPASDQFSFCVALYEALHGTPPFAGDTVSGVMANIEARRFSPSATGRSVPGRVRRALSRGLSPYPSARFETMEALLAALRPTAASRRQIGALAAITAGAVGVGGLAWAQAHPSPCQRADEAIAAVWAPAARTQLTEHFSATELPYANDVTRSVMSALDEYAASWATMRRDACHATHIDNTQSAALLDLRMACLDDRLQEFAAVVDVLRTASPDAVSNAADAAHRLRALDGCADTRALQAATEATAIDPRISAQLARVKALADAGSFAEARTLAEAAVERATSADDAASMAAAGLSLAWVAAHTGASDTAEDRLLHALDAAEASRNDAIRARTLSLLVFVVGYQGARYDEAQRWARWAQTVLDRSHAGSIERARLNRYRGLIAQEQGAFERAAQYHGRALDLLDAAQRKNHPEMVKALAGRADALRALERLPQAEADYRRALGLEEARLGASHPRVANTIHGLGNVLERARKFEDAEAAYRRALAIHVAALGPDHFDVAGDHLALGQVLLARDDLEASDAELTAAVQWFVRERPEHPRTAVAFSATANLRFRQSRPAEALRMLERSLEIRRRATPNHPDLAVILHNLGVTYEDLGHGAQAIETLREADRIARTALGEEHRFTGVNASALGRALQDAGQLEPARVELERALAIWTDAPALPRDACLTKLSLAQVRWSLDLRADALTLAEDASDSCADDEALGLRLDTWLAEHRN